jgi:hypothetical protein
MRSVPVMNRELKSIDTQPGLERKRQSKPNFPCFQNEIRRHFLDKFGQLNEPYIICKKDLDGE